VPIYLNIIADQPKILRLRVNRVPHRPVDLEACAVEFLVVINCGPDALGLHVRDRGFRLGVRDQDQFERDAPGGENALQAKIKRWLRSVQMVSDDDRHDRGHKNLAVM
jgi:hypothetical protein